MAKQLYMKTWKEVEKEMSIAGEPERARVFGQAVFDLSARSMDVKNIPSVDNQIFALEKVIADLENWKRSLEKRKR